VAEKPYILHMLTADEQMSPFDINMAADAGYGMVIPHTRVGLSQVAALTQDAIFSRGPKGVRRTGLFIGGRDGLLAEDMFDVARKAMVPPFEASVMVDPSGAFTTAAAAIACLERHLRDRTLSLTARRVAIFGGTGPVGTAAAVLAARAGARVGLVARADLDRTRQFCQQLTARHGVVLDVLDATSPAARSMLMAEVEVALATAKAGVQVISASDLTQAARMLVVADINAVPPSGIEGVGAFDNGAELSAGSGQARAIGALTIGNVKYQTEKGLFEAMLSAQSARYLGLDEALSEARRHAGLN